MSLGYFPAWLEKELEKNITCEYMKEYVREIYQADPEKFIINFRKTRNHSRRNGFGKESHSILIAANFTQLSLSKYKHHFVCYYCHLPLQLLDDGDIHFEHFIPKVQSPANIVHSCKWCDSFKRDRMPRDFELMLLDDQYIELDKYTKTEFEKLKLKHFAPLVVVHAPSGVETRMIVFEKMIQFAKEDFKKDIRDEKFIDRVRWCYYQLYRSKWLPPEIGNW